jgi:hypothetical protein
MEQLITNTRLFSEAFAGRQGQLLDKILLMGSRSREDFKQRKNTYEKVNKRYDELRDIMKLWSSYGDTALQANQYFNATISGTAKSFAGYLSIERDMDQANSLLHYVDTIDVNSGNTVLPNVGAENLTGPYRAPLVLGPTNLVNGTFAYTISFGTQLLPGTVNITLSISSVTYTITDNKVGGLVAPPGILAADSYSAASTSVNYTSGAINFTIIPNPAASGPFDTWSAAAVQNQTNVANVNRFKLIQKDIMVSAYPELLVGEVDFVSLAALQKSLGINAAEVMTSKLTELYTKVINQAMVGQIQSQDSGSAVTIDMQSSNFHDYRSTIDKFAAMLNNVDQAMAIKSVKGTKATAYVCGSDVVTTFRKTALLGGNTWVDSPTDYINDLVGFYNGIPVLEHTDIASTSGYAVHKTKDGNLAPLMRGIYLPLTTTPNVGNYQNPGQLSVGLYYSEATKGIVPQLQQKFTLANLSSGN